MKLMTIHLHLRANFLHMIIAAGKIFCVPIISLILNIPVYEKVDMLIPLIFAGVMPMMGIIGHMNFLCKIAILMLSLI